ncbi:MAG: nucleoside triphosphate pyrophosphatase [Synechococcales bacterium]|nr:nucleoside triphosphate pyrophosphatase [Synechococcales bacterium]
MAIPFVLASASPARRRLLQLAGIDPFVFPSAFDEDSIQLRDPAVLVQALAVQKLRASLQKLWHQRGSAPGGFFSAQPGVMLGCDSVLALQGEIYGKPDGVADAIARWKQMRGQVGELFTGHALCDGYTTSTGELHPAWEIVRCQVTRVFFAEVSDRQIEAYVATGEPLLCAGCFALEGKGSVFVEKIEGCHTNVIGLSMPLLRQMLAEMDCDVTDFWKD